MPDNLPMPVLPVELTGEDDEGRLTVWGWLLSYEPGSLAFMFDPLKSPLEFEATAFAHATRRRKAMGVRTLSAETAKALETNMVRAYDPDTLELTFA